MTKKCSKGQKERMISLRHAEYYGTQEVRDELYEKAKKGEVFTNLTSLIFCDENIMEAYRNIKRNSGSHTPGTDGKSISDIGRLSPEEVTGNVRKFVLGKHGYRPKPVRRKTIPKPNGGTRPLGIPCIWDRLIQQCIKQVMEPICEAHFSNHSYGFRPGRSVENAIAEAYRYLNQSHLYYVVEVDIKGFFDNVDHAKLLRQLWAMGIQDKQLLYILKKILKAPIRLENGAIVTPNSGTPQGGIISPLLANVVLNELDQWIDSQWENNPVTDKYSQRVRYSGYTDKTSGYYAMKGTRLKEMRITRYADDFRIFCRKRKDAQKAMIAVTNWLQERLHLDVSVEKTRVVNTKKQSMSFLGFEIRMRKKAHKWVTSSNISHKKKKQIEKKLKDQIKAIARTGDSRKATAKAREYNAIVLGEQNYFQIATNVNKDMMDIEYEVKKTLHTQLKSDRLRGGRLTKKGILSAFEQKRYGKSKMLRFDKASGVPIYPIGYIQTKKPMHVRHGQTPYSKEGRSKIHTALGINVALMVQLMKTPVYRSIEYADNRVSLFAAQWGRCGITGRDFMSTEEIHCHHKTPLEQGGTDAYGNLILLLDEVHRLIHATNKETIASLIQKLSLTAKEMAKVNALRKQAKLYEISF